MRHQEFQELETFSLIEAIDSEQTRDITITRHNNSQEIVDGPGIALINPTNKSYREMIAFAGVGEWNSTLVLRGVVRGVDTGIFNHPAGVELYIDQGEQYARLPQESRKEILKRCLRTLTR